MPKDTPRRRPRSLVTRLQIKADTIRTWLDNNQIAQDSDGWNELADLLDEAAEVVTQIQAHQAMVRVYRPDEIEAMTGLARREIIRLLHAERYAFTKITPHTIPWGPGRQKWGMTIEQIRRMLDGQARRMPGEPKPETTTTTTKPATGKPKSRIKPRYIPGL